MKSHLVTYQAYITRLQAYQTKKNAGKGPVLIFHIWSMIWSWNFPQRNSLSKDKDKYHLHPLQLIGVYFAWIFLVMSARTKTDIIA